MPEIAASASRAPTDWTRRLWVPLLLVVVTGVPYAFSGALHSAYVFDDEKLIRDNEAIRDLSTIYKTFDVTSDRWDEAELRANYRPLRFLSYAVDYHASRWLVEAWGSKFDETNPPVLLFHLTNLLFHFINALLVLSIGRRLFGHGVTALVLAFVFALHPIQTEAVAYMSGRRDVLSLFFFLVALRIYLGQRDVRSYDGSTPFDRLWAGRIGYFGSDSRSRPLSLIALVAIPFLFVCGFLTKEMVVTLPAVVVLIDILAREPLRARRLALHSVLWLFALVLTAHEVLDPRLVAEPVAGATSTTLLMIPRYVMRYFFLLLAPFNQTIDYSFNAIPESTGLFSPISTFVSLLLVVALLGLGVWWLVCGRAREKPGVRAGRSALLALGVLWFLGTLTPVLQIVPIPERFAERFVYLPGLGILLVGAVVFRRLERFEVILSRGLALFLVVVLGGLTYSRCRDWRSPRFLWQSATESYPECARAHIGYANELLKSEHVPVREVAREFNHAIAILESDPEGILREPLRHGELLRSRFSRAQALSLLGQQNSDKYRQAIADYLWLLKQKDVDGTPIAESDKYLRIDYELASCYMGVGDWKKARPLFRKIVERGHPDGAVRAAHYNLGQIYRGQSLIKEAVAEFEAAWSIVRDRGTLRDRYRLVGEFADVLLQDSQAERAREILEPILKDLEKSSADDLREGRKHHLYRLAKIHNQRKRIRVARTVLNEALAIDSNYGPALLSLATIEEQTGDLEVAEKLFKKVLAMSPGNPVAERGLTSIKIKRTLAEREDTTVKEDREKLSNVSALVKRGKQHFDNLELKAAEDLFRRASDTEASTNSSKYAEVQAQRAEGMRMLGRIGMRYGRSGEAERWFLAALELGTGNQEVLLDLADLKYRPGDGGSARSARRFYEEYLSKFDDGELGKPRAYARLGLLIQDEDPLEAIEYLLLAKKAGSKDVTLTRQLGFVYSRAGEWEKALDQFQTFLDTTDDEAQKGMVIRFVDKEVLPNLPDGDELREQGRGTR